MEIKVTVPLALSPDLPTPSGASLEVGKIVLAHLEAQALAGRDKTGAAFPDAKGPKAINLHSSVSGSPLWESATVEPGEGVSGAIVFSAPYAEYVLPRYQADGLNADSRHEAEREIELYLSRETIVL